jgi:hypothetical protein
MLRDLKIWIDIGTGLSDGTATRGRGTRQNIEFTKYSDKQTSVIETRITTTDMRRVRFNLGTNSQIRFKRGDASD